MGIDFEISAAPTRAVETGQPSGETSLRIPFQQAPDEDFLRQLTRADELDHKVFAPKVDGNELILRVRTSELADVPAFMGALEKVIAEINAERVRRREDAARLRAREEQRRADIAAAIDRDLEHWWHGRTPAASPSTEG